MSSHRTAEPSAPGYPARLGRAFEGLAAWLAVAPPEPADRELEATILPTLVHLSRDNFLLAWYRPLGSAFGSREALAVHRDPATRKRLEERLEELARLRARWARELARWDRRVPVLRAIATQSWGLPDDLGHAYFQQLATAFDAADTPRGRALLVQAMVRLAPPAHQHEGAFTCPDRTRLTAALTRSAGELAAAPRRPRRRSRPSSRRRRSTGGTSTS